MSGESMSFDEWSKYNLGYVGREAYEAGAQSRQDEIDELQKLINEATEWIELNKKNIPLSEWHGYTTEEYIDADDLLDILKGQNND